MTGRLLIQIEDPANFNKCYDALKSVYETIKQHQGDNSAKHIFALASYHPDHASPYLGPYPGLFRLCRDKNFRLAVEFHNMPAPNKLKLAKELARRNKVLPPKDRYGPNGSSDHEVMHQQIKRVLRQPKYQIAADPGARAKANQFIHMLFDANR
jgi:hypothetical protein